MTADAVGIAPLAASATGMSVVVPTFGSPASVQRLLRSLRIAVRELPAGAGAEIIVVDDSRPVQARAIARLCEQYGARCVPGPRRVGAKRNTGTALARYPILFYIDSDCVADSAVLRAHLATHAAHEGHLSLSGRPVGAVAGPTVVDDTGTNRAWRVVAPSVVTNSPWLWPAKFREVWWAATANLSVRREAFDRVGGFDDLTFTVVGGEDVDFGVRLSVAGYATICAKDAVVRHATDGITTLRQFRAKTFRYGRACVYNCVRQPEHARWSANPASLAAIGGVMGLAALIAAGRDGAVCSPLRRMCGYLGIGSVALVGVGFAARAAQAARREKIPLSDGVGMVSVDWAFHAGITAEALRRGRPVLAFRRYDYFQPGRFYPAGEASAWEAR